MLTLRPHGLLALALVACTSLDPATQNKPVANAEGKPVVDTKPVTDTKKDPPPPEVKSAVQIAVASVQLDQDCPDPPASAVVPTAGARATPRSMPAPVPNKPGDSPAESMSAAAYRMSCAQSTLQMKLTNAGKAGAEIRIASINVRDVQSDSVLAPVKSRGPSAWNAASTYEAWDEKIAGGAEMQVSYRLTPPDWYALEGKLGGGASSRGREFDLEVTVEVDGKPVTVRSPAFRRPPEIIVPAT